MPPYKHIFLIGFSGSGKSTLGPILAKGLKARFVDIDLQIEKKAGLNISEIFARRGEAAFRRLEEQTVRKQVTQARMRSVLALGGGAYESATIRKLAKTHGIVVYLSCSRREIYRRMKSETDRPLLKRGAVGQDSRAALMGRIGQLLDRRLPRYRTADITVSITSRTPAQAAHLARLLIRKYDEAY